MSRAVRRLLFPLLLVFCLLFPGCASYSDLPSGAVQEVVGSPVVEREVVTVPLQTREATPSPDYRIGSGDVLFVNVSGRPELGSPVTPGLSGKVQGSRVDGSGYIHLPLVESVQVAGLTLEETQGRLKEAYRRYVKDPWVVVEVAEYKSHPLHLLGQFRLSGTQYMDRPLTLLEGISLGGGLTDFANLRGARLIRGGETLAVDLQRLLQEGATEENIWLKAGDTIFVPDDRNQKIFVFGAVDKPGSIPMPDGQLTLGQALAAAGMDGASDDENHIRIIRSLSATRGELIVVDMQEVLRGRTLPFPLVEGDIVYVPRSRLGNWNEAIETILPSLRGISAVLQPFVQISLLKHYGND